MKLLTYLVILGMSVVGCSNNNGNGNDAGNDVTPNDSSSDSASDATATATQACNAEATAICALRDMCSPGYNVTDVYGSDSVCQTRTAEACVNALAQPGNANTPAMVDACASAYPSEACSSFFDDNPVSACVPPAGSRGNGMACGASAQCTSAYCGVTQYAVCGTCQPLPIVGASCQVEADCGRDLACATPTLAQGDAGIPAPKCAAWVAASGSCLSGYQPCQSGLSCVGDDEATMTMGTCQASGAAVSAACDGSRKTMPACNADMGLVCIPTAKGSAVGTCQNISLASATQPCGDIGSDPITGFAVCQTGLCAKVSPTATTGTCVADAMDNAACNTDPTMGPSCLAPSKCVVTGTGTTGTCMFPNAVTCM
jgi:hypothetical protein